VIENGVQMKKNKRDEERKDEKKSKTPTRVGKDQYEMWEFDIPSTRSFKTIIFCQKK